MSDTQWPCFEVFQQTREDAPFDNVGSVHAPDPEMALQNARDVFVRRPEAHRLWVVPASVILTKTAEELAQEPNWRDDMVAEDVPTMTYYVFNKATQRRSMTFVRFVGKVEAATPVQALAQAVDHFGQEPVYVWWIVPAKAVLSSRDEDALSMFSSVYDKSYRMPNEYRTRTLMDEVKRGG